MRAVVQRVSQASVTVGAKVVGSIETGLLVLLGIKTGDTDQDAKYLAEKVVNLRIFPDDNEKMNLSILDIRGEVLAVSQFTLFGDCRKGRRPSYNEAAPPDIAKDLYEQFVREIRSLGVPCACGEFQTMMKVALINDGPVTILLDSERIF